jgi:hypothetical protein
MDMFKRSSSQHKELQELMTEEYDAMYYMVLSFRVVHIKLSSGVESCHFVPIFGIELTGLLAYYMVLSFCANIWAVNKVNQWDLSFSFMVAEYSVPCHFLSFCFMVDGCQVVCCLSFSFIFFHGSTVPCL